jgi:CheY-like chemotaxis protein
VKPQRTLSGSRILAVEDEYLIAEELRYELVQAGAVVLGPVARVTDALNLIAREARIDGAILDINLRGDMVFPVADELALRGVPFVFASGYDLSVIPKRFEHVVTCGKPTRMSAVVRALGRLIQA